MHYYYIIIMYVRMFRNRNAEWILCVMDKKSRCMELLWQYVQITLEVVQLEDLKKGPLLIAFVDNA